MAEEYMQELDKDNEPIKDGEIDIDIIDDLPPEDRNKEPMTEDPEPKEEELASYSDKVKKRISTLQRAYHDERRAKEQATREQQEALRYAQNVSEQNKSLIQKTNSSATLLHETWKSKAESDLERAKQSYKTAYENDDSDAIIEAQEAMSRATMRHENSLTKEPPLQQEINEVKQGQDVYTAPAPDQKATAWVSKNPWFGKDRRMTSLAYGVHEELIANNIHPEKDAIKYYEEIDKAMRQTFPNFDWGDEKPGNPRQSRAATVVASVTRTATGKRVALTQTQVAIAKRLNVPLAEYAKQVAVINGANNG